VARLADVRPIGLTPKRRTAITMDGPDGADCAGWPLVADIGETFYFKPESGRILASPADETPMPPCDVQPDELDVAITVDRIETATTLQVRRIEHKWAGLRCFVADKSLVIGFDDRAEGFFWLAGQGGYGIQTAPAAGRLAAALATVGEVPADIAALGVTAAEVSPARLDRA
jgi:D-arginine dehydrogenase